jgi:hypothetical protein
MLIAKLNQTLETDRLSFHQRLGNANQVGLIVKERTIPVYWENYVFY